MKKFETLGRSLSKHDQKRIIGGNVVCISCSDGSTLCAGNSNYTCSGGASTVSCTSGNNTVVYSCPRNPNE